MAHCIGALVMVKVRPNFADRQTMRLGQELGKRRHFRIGASVVASHIKLDPIAGAEDRGLGAVTLAKLVESLLELGIIKSEPLPHGHRRVAKTASYCEEPHHGESPAAKG